MMNYPKSFIARHIRFINDDVIEVRTAMSAIIKFAILFICGGLAVITLLTSGQPEMRGNHTTENFLLQNLKWIFQPMREAKKLYERIENNNIIGLNRSQLKKEIDEFNRGNIYLTYQEFKTQKAKEYTEYLEKIKLNPTYWKERKAKIEQLAIPYLSEEYILSQWERIKKVVYVGREKEFYLRFKQDMKVEAFTVAEEELDKIEKTPFDPNEKEDKLREMWEEYQNNLESLLYKDDRFAKQVYEEVIRAWEPIFLLFFGILFSLHIPNSRSIRIDRKRRIIYFQGRNKFYIYRYPDITDGMKLVNYLPLVAKNRITSFYNGNTRIPSSEHGLFIKLQATEDKSLLTRRLGAFNMSFKGDALLANFLLDFMTSREPDQFRDYKNAKNLHPFILLLSLSAFNFKYNEKNTEYKIQKWLIKTPDKTEKELEKETKEKWWKFSHQARMEQLEKRKVKPKTKNRKRNK